MFSDTSYIWNDVHHRLASNESSGGGVGSLFLLWFFWFITCQGMKSFTGYYKSAQKYGEHGFANINTKVSDLGEIFY